MRRALHLGALLLIASSTLIAGIKVTVRNPSNVERRFETIEVDWQKMRALNPSLTPANVAVFNGKEQIPSQCLDGDGDGAVDHLLFQVNLHPRAVQTLSIMAEKHPRVFPSAVDARFEVPREDVAWESDRIAYRIYGPALAAEVNNGLDVWVKRVRTLIVDKWYSASAAAKKDTYHEDHGEGADFFAVGRTLGAGACAIAKGDSLYQPGVFTMQRITATGPIRAMFTVVYEKGSIDGVPYKEVKTYAIDAGHNLNRIQVTYTGLRSNDSLRFVAGLVKRKDVVCEWDSVLATMALWGPVNDDPVNEYLGTGVVLPKPGFAGMKELKDQYVLSAHVKVGVPITYVAGAGWTRSGDFKIQSDWTKLLKYWARCLAEPIVVTISK
jgi:pectinesterase